MAITTKSSISVNAGFRAGWISPLMPEVLPKSNILLKRMKIFAMLALLLLIIDRRTGNMQVFLSFLEEFLRLVNLELEFDVSAV
jgi:hypothetical protein